MFVGEVEEGRVVGFHNWIQFYLCERAGQVNYLGHLLPRGRRAPDTPSHPSAACITLRACSV